MVVVAVVVVPTAAVVALKLVVNNYRVYHIQYVLS